MAAVIYSTDVSRFFKAVRLRRVGRGGTVAMGLCARAELVSAAFISSTPLFVPLFPSLTPGMAEAPVVCVCDDKKARSPSTVPGHSRVPCPGVRVQGELLA